MEKERVEKTKTERGKETNRGEGCQGSRQEG